MVFSISGDLPFGRVSAPGAGMMPKLMTGLMMLFAGLVLIAAKDGPRLSDIDWSDKAHALLVVLITAAAVLLYRKLGFLLTMSFLVFALLVVVERKRLLVSAAYAIGLTLAAYWLFGKALKSPLERGVFWL